LGADPSLKNDAGYSSVSVAEQQGHEEIVDVLLKYIQEDSSSSSSSTPASSSNAPSGSGGDVIAGMDKMQV
jgi:ankyrin repeat protein